MRWLTGLALLIFVSVLNVPKSFSDPYTEEDAFGSFYVCSTNLTDVDGDGDLDAILSSNYGENNSLYINDGTGQFTLDEDVFSLPDNYTIAIGFADVDADGDLDAGVIDRAMHGNRLYINDGFGSFTYYVHAFGMGDSEMIAYADADLDGDIDAAVCNNDFVPSMLFLNDGFGNFAEQEAFNSSEDFDNIGCWGDFDGDGDPDFVVGCSSVRIYWNDGSANFTEQIISSGEERITEALAVADVDNDGDMDIGEANMYEGTHQNRLFRNDGSGNFEQEDEFGDGFLSYTIAFGDLDHDGDVDAVVGDACPEQAYLYRNDGTGHFSEEDEFGTHVKSLALGDVDGDGDLDVALGTINDSPQNKLYRNEQNDSNWISIKAIGRYYELGSGYSNRDGIGAKVYLYEEGHLGEINYLLGFQEVSAESGHLGQDPYEAHFGVPEGDAVDVRIVWPGSFGSHFTDDYGSIPKGDKYLCVENAGIYNIEVDLVYFGAKPFSNSIRLTWVIKATEGEHIAGFNLYRREMNNNIAAEVSNLGCIWTKVNTGLITGQNPCTYTDSNVEAGVAYEYQLEAVLVDEGVETLGITQATAGQPTSFAILALYPNPASDYLTCLLTLPEAGAVELALYDLSGRLVAKKDLKALEPSEMEVVLEVAGLASGVYTLRAFCGGTEVSARAVVVR